MYIRVLSVGHSVTGKSYEKKTPKIFPGVFWVAEFVNDGHKSPKLTNLFVSSLSVSQYLKKESRIVIYQE